MSRGIKRKPQRKEEAQGSSIMDMPNRRRIYRAGDVIHTPLGLRPDAKRTDAAYAVEHGLSRNAVVRARGKREGKSEDRIRAQFERAFENIELARRRMANDQIEIDRLRTETRQMIAELLT